MGDKNIHAGHRKRTRESFLKRDISSLHDHEILEMLLFYAHPRNDTNSLAHRLIDIFGSLENVLSASYEDLLKVDGIGENAAVLLILFSKLSIRYANYLRQDNGYADKDKIMSTLMTRFQQENKEQVMAVLFDSKGKLMNISNVGSGGINDASFKARELTEVALRCNATRVVLAHNHPQGFAIPSSTDVETTRKVKSILRPLEIELTDHIIFAGTDSYSMKDSGKYLDIF